MKKIILSILGLLPLFSLSAQDIQGAWQWERSNGDGVELQHMAIVAGDFFSEAIYEKDSGKFLDTRGGSYILSNGNLILAFEFSVQDPDLVGNTVSLSHSLSQGKMIVDGTPWSRIDDGRPGELSGAWLISGRQQEGKIEMRETSGPRKTMKILSGTRFQWIAYNTQTKAFMGTGGGTYTTVDGAYTETIGFFSRDDSRVGATLPFGYELKDGNWHHFGKSSKGEPIYEVWSKREL